MTHRVESLLHAQRQKSSQKTIQYGLRVHIYYVTTLKKIWKDTHQTDNRREKDTERGGVK